MQRVASMSQLTIVFCNAFVVLCFRVVSSIPTSISRLSSSALFSPSSSCSLSVCFSDSLSCITQRACSCGAKSAGLCSLHLCPPSSANNLDSDAFPFHSNFCSVQVGNHFYAEGSIESQILSSTEVISITYNANARFYSECDSKTAEEGVSQASAQTEVK